MDSSFRWNDNAFPIHNSYWNDKNRHSNKADTFSTVIPNLIYSPCLSGKHTGYVAKVNLKPEEVLLRRGPVLYYLHAAFRNSRKKLPAVTLSDNSAVKNNHYPGIGFCANQSAESLFEFYYRARQLIC